MRKMMSKYDILRAISRREPATLQSIYNEIEREDSDAGSLTDELVDLVSEGFVEERARGQGVLEYVLTESGKKALEAL
jgi:DNA-binding PadR family transcriptional regulator